MTWRFPGGIFNFYVSVISTTFGCNSSRYSYDPFQQSPNENPEAELAINAGDYLLVWGNMDEVN
jgi:hypothetical protein